MRETIKNSQKNAGIDGKITIRNWVSENNRRKPEKYCASEAFYNVTIGYNNCVHGCQECPKKLTN